jgi:Ca-activated chloride channel family protein
MAAKNGFVSRTKKEISKVIQPSLNDFFKKKHMNIRYLLLLYLCSFSAFAQQDTLVAQREARRFVREGNELYKNKKHTEAAISYKKATEKAATYFKAAHNLGNALFEQTNYKEAITQYELALKGAKTPQEKAQTHHNIGNAHVAEKDFEKAVEAFKNSLRNNPKDEETRYNLAHALQQLKKHEEETNKNKQDPPSAYAKRMKKKADALLEKFQFKKALELMDKALLKDKTVANYKDYMKKLESVIEIKEAR